MNIGSILTSIFHSIKLIMFLNVLIIYYNNLKYFYYSLSTEIRLKTELINFQMF